MIDRKEACKILNVREDATKADVQRRYSIILKKYRSVESVSNESDKAELDRVTLAYNLLMGYDTDDPQAEAINNRPPSVLLKKMGIDEKKAGNFLYYHKYHIIVGIILLLFVAFSLKSCLSRIPADFSMALIGKIYCMDTEVLKKNIMDKYPGIKEIDIRSVPFASVEENFQQESAIQSLAAILFSIADTDVFIVDRERFEKHGTRGSFSRLEDILAEAGLPVDDSRAIMLAPDHEAGSEGIYGFDVTASPIFGDSQIAGEEFIFAVGVKAKNKDKAASVLKILAGVK